MAQVDFQSAGQTIDFITNCKDETGYQVFPYHVSALNNKNECHLINWIMKTFLKKKKDSLVCYLWS